ncbi:putative tyrosinase-like protein tyr-3 [Folsomia candida]|uniref:Putative tyrosinase-like protein tyr-3 n=1 Tax=Folsomia candida TaxID=158441 RepID=A0A226E831_FOLCA|nr:putative tyrosinase-like protein tyr-3 [Folsomia candida]
MKVTWLVCWIVSVLMRPYFLDAAPRERNFNDWQETHSPWGRMLAMMSEVRSIQCQRGFYNISDAVIDSAFHCANLKHPKKSRMHFRDELVDWEGESPMLCFKTCVMRESGAMNDDNTGIDKERAHRMFFAGMRKPGGHMSVDVMTEELVECDQKYVHCVDFNDSCPLWARGDCNSPLMEFYCAKSCGKCDKCQEEPGVDKKCDVWAKRGECERRPEYMQTRCRISCGLCRPS